VRIMDAMVGGDSLVGAVAHDPHTRSAAPDLARSSFVKAVMSARSTPQLRSSGP
jgi:hypothetical protein